MGHWFDAPDDPDRAAAFRERLRASLDALEQLLLRPAFGRAAATLGAELEMFLAGPDGTPVPANQEIRAATGDGKVVLEVNRYNLEANLTPVPLTGRPFTALHGELLRTLRTVTEAAAEYRARPVTVGILPTLRPEHLGHAYLTPAARFEALEHAFARGRSRPFPVSLDAADGGPDYVLDCDSIGVQGAACSWQLHLAVPPGQYARAYNAAQLATAPALAAAVNSPLLCGRPLWQETRIPLYEQGFGDRAAGHGRGTPRVLFGERWLRRGVGELYEDTVLRFDPLLAGMSEEDPGDVVRLGGLPRLEELLLHQSTVWRWNRPVYDPTGDGHLRIEFRALPSGPTPTDMVANAAFLLGLTLHLGARGEELTGAGRFPFSRARENFYRAARHGLGARLWWCSDADGRCAERPAATLVTELLPGAADGLVRSGVEAAEAERWLSVIARRAPGGRTGAAWQRAAARAPADDGHSALPALARRYARLSAEDRPVHTWPDLRRG